MSAGTGDRDSADPDPSPAGERRGRAGEGTLRRECLDHIIVIVVNDQHLWAILGEFVSSTTSIGHVALPARSRPLR